MALCWFAQLLVFVWVLQDNGCAQQLPQGDADVKQTHTFNWKYQDDHNTMCSGQATPCGPSDWQHIPGYESCSGNPGTQSPIDLIHAHETLHPTYTTSDLQLKCDIDADCKMVDYILNEHTVEVDLTDTCAKRCHATWNGQIYYLEQFHYHSPSEHMVDGGYFPMEVHHVHRADTGEALVIAVLVTVGDKPDGAPNFTYSQGEYMREIFEQVPKPDTSGTNNFYRSRSGKPSMGLNPYTTFIPTLACGFRYYVGSFTTPPCTPQTTWIIAPEPVRVVQATLDIYRSIINSNPNSQLAKYGEIVGLDSLAAPAWNPLVQSSLHWDSMLGCNNRPLQALGDRFVYKIKAPDDSLCNKPVISPCDPVTTAITTTTTTNVVATCVGYVCPYGSHPRPNPKDLLCHLPSGCNQLDAELCCEGIDRKPCITTTPTYTHPTCANYKCPSGLVLRPNADSVHCFGATCGTGDAIRCCVVYGSTTPSTDPCSTSNFWGNFRRPEVIAGTAVGGAAVSAGIIGAIAGGIAAAHNKETYRTTPTPARRSILSGSGNNASSTTDWFSGIRAREQVESDGDTGKWSSSNDLLTSLPGAWGVVCLVGALVGLLGCLAIGLALCIRRKKSKKKKPRERGHDDKTPVHRDYSRQLRLEEQGHLVTTDGAHDYLEQSLMTDGSEYGIVPLDTGPLLSTQENLFDNIHFGELGAVTPYYQEDAYQIGLPPQTAVGSMYQGQQPPSYNAQMYQVSGPDYAAMYGTVPQMQEIDPALYSVGYQAQQFAVPPWQAAQYGQYGQEYGQYGMVQPSQVL